MKLIFFVSIGTSYAFISVNQPNGENYVYLTLYRT